MIAAAISRQEGVDQNGVSSALLVYSWVTMLHMLQELPVAMIPFYGKKLKSIFVLGKDYFGSANVKRENTISTEALNDTACLLFDDGSLELIDLDFGRSVKIDIGPVKSVNVNAAGEICALTQDNRLINVEIEVNRLCLKPIIIPFLALYSELEP